jgi:hypothetical protein
VVEAEEKAGEALRSEPAEAKPSSEAVEVVVGEPPQTEPEAEDSRIGRGPSDEATGAAEHVVARVEETMMRDVTAALPAKTADARPDQMAPKEEAGGADMASEKPGHDDEEEEDEDEDEDEEESAQLLKWRECCTTETTTWMRYSSCVCGGGACVRPDCD